MECEGVAAAAAGGLWLDVCGLEGEEERYTSRGAEGRTGQTPGGRGVVEGS